MEIVSVNVRIPVELKAQVDDYLKEAKAVDLKYSLNDCILDSLRLLVAGGLAIDPKTKEQSLSTSDRLRSMREQSKVSKAKD